MISSELSIESELFSISKLFADENEEVNDLKTFQRGNETRVLKNFPGLVFFLFAKLIHFYTMNIGLRYSTASCIEISFYASSKRNAESGQATKKFKLSKSLKLAFFHKARPCASKW